MRIRLSILALMFVGGCMSTAPIMPERYQLSIPTANAADVVLIGSSAIGKTLEDGNTYTITWMAQTNVNSDLVDNPAVILANGILATNTWPKYRMHMDLSIDGGRTWVRRIGYGIQTPKGSTGSEFSWSPPEDYSLLTTNAKLRLVDLDGKPFTGPTNGLPCDIGTNGIRSPIFSIVGAVIDAPAAGATLFVNAPATVTWRQVGGGSRADLYAVTPTAQSYLTTFSNVVNGLNSRAIFLAESFPPAAEMRFAIRGVEYPVIVGYSGTFEVMQ